MVKNFKSERPTSKHSLCFKARMVHLKSFLPHDVDVLDVGCGEGLIDEYLIKNNCRTTGIDYSKEAIAMASVLKGEYILTDIYEFKPKKKFNRIICTEVLEHLKDDRKALKLIYSWLNPGGKLILSVPTFMDLSKIIKKNAGHIRHYEPEELKDLITKIGFKIEKEKQWGCLFRRLILCYLSVPASKIPIKILSVFGKVFGALIEVESYFCPVNDSIILLLKKPK